ncbi:MAG: hypothetical protein ACNS62_06805 [Candidatus Cyclobacteriaceae bacterium M3_2C_046]
MKKFKTIFYIIYLLFILTSLILLITEWEFLSTSFGLLPVWMPYLIILGMLLIITEWIVENIHIKQLKNKITKLEKENLNLKAKLFDQEEAYKEGDRSLKAFGDSLEEKESKNRPGEEDQKNEL